MRKVKHELRRKVVPHEKWMQVSVLNFCGCEKQALYTVWQPRPHCFVIAATALREQKSLRRVNVSLSVRFNAVASHFNLFTNPNMNQVTPWCRALVLMCLYYTASLNEKQQIICLYWHLRSVNVDHFTLNRDVWWIRCILKCVHNHIMM